MHIPRIYLPQPLDIGLSIQLPKESRQHLVQVLRLREGAHFNVFNGDGHDYATTLETADKNAIARVTARMANDVESPLKITLFQGISRGDRMDFSLQKAVELGVHSIVPVITERSKFKLSGERLEKKLLHWQKITISAAEQSGRSRVPELSMALSYREALSKSALNSRYLLHPSEAKPLSQLARSEESACAVFIGPESGFSEAEVQQAQELGWQYASLGPRVLRTETATVAALTVLQSVAGDI